jgi:hypothetical protein
MKAERYPVLEVVGKRSDFGVCTYDNIVMLVWTGPPTLEGVSFCARAFTKLHDARPYEPLGFYTLISEQAQQGTLPESVRKALGRMLKENEAWIGSAVIAYEGSGFRATIVRSVITAINLAARPRFPASVHSHRGAAAERMLQELGPGARATTAYIMSLLHDLCAQSAA